MVVRPFNTRAQLSLMSAREVHAWIKRADELGLGDCVARGKSELASRIQARGGKAPKRT